MKQTVHHGDTLKDSISGFNGVIEAVAIWLNGCVQVRLQPAALDKDGQKPMEAQWFDSQQLRDMNDIEVQFAGIDPQRAIRKPAHAPLFPGGPIRDNPKR